MQEVFESVSQEALPETGARESAVESQVVAETEGSRGEDNELSSQVEELVVTGTQKEPLEPRARRVGTETVIGPDERIRIVDTNNHPWRMIAALRLIPRPPLTSAFIGTVWFIGRRTLLTAGHCVHSDSDYGGWIGRIEVSPGRNDTTFPFGTAQAVRFSTLSRWQTDSDPDYDVGCIHLDEPLGDRVGYFKIAAKTDAELAERLLNVSGYPGDRGNGRLQFHHKNRVLHPAARRIYYDIDTYGGQSGSPVWIQDSPTDEPIAVGIHAYGIGGTPSSLNITANSAPRLIPSLIDTIRGWLADDGQ